MKRWRRMKGQIDVHHGGWPSANYGWRFAVAIGAVLVLLWSVGWLLLLAHSLTGV